MGVSGISNVAMMLPTAGARASHEEVLEAGALLVPRMTSLICGVLGAVNFHPDANVL